MTIGRKRRRAASSAASSGAHPFACSCARTRRSGSRSSPRGRSAPRGRSGSRCRSQAAQRTRRRARRTAANGTASSTATGKRPALVVRGEDQEHHDDREAERDDRPLADALLLERLAGPRDRVAGGQRLARLPRPPRSPGPSSRPARCCRAPWPRGSRCSGRAARARRCSARVISALTGIISPRRRAHVDVAEVLGLRAVRRRRPAAARGTCGRTC